VEESSELQWNREERREGFVALRVEREKGGKERWDDWSSSVKFLPYSRAHALISSPLIHPINELISLKEGLVGRDGDRDARILDRTNRRRRW
jgi:hypothetical protein